MLPFCTTTQSLPEKRRLRRIFSIAAESKSASLILLRNSVKTLSSLVGSVWFMVPITSARITEPGDNSTLAHGTKTVNKNIAVDIQLKSLYFFEKMHAR